MPIYLVSHCSALSLVGSLLCSLTHLQCAAQGHAAILGHAVGLIVPADALHRVVIPRGPHVTESIHEWVETTGVGYGPTGHRE